MVRELKSRGFEVEELSRRDATHWFDQWRQTFLGDVQAATGRYRYRGCHWHAYSYDLVRALNGETAVDAYLRQLPEQVLVIPEDWSHGCGIRCRGTRLPDFTDHLQDLYVFPESLAWSMAFTHEQPSLGPYFVVRDGDE
jgi:hypothetical protein